MELPLLLMLLLAPSVASTASLLVATPSTVLTASRLPRRKLACGSPRLENLPAGNLPTGSGPCQTTRATSVRIIKTRCPVCQQSLVQIVNKPFRAFDMREIYTFGHIASLISQNRSAILAWRLYLRWLVWLAVGWANMFNAKNA